jgi:hypothetical protein
MATRWFRAVFTIGKCLTITPPYDSRISLSQKIYTSVLVTTITTLVAMSIITKRGYQGYTYDKVTVNLILDFILSIFCSYTPLSIALWKEQQWENLMQNLRSILFTNKNTKKILRHVKICFAKMATNLVILILIYSFWANHFGPFYYSQRYGILYIELLLVYSFNTFLSLILNVLLTQYQYLNHQLDEQMGSKVVFTQKLVHSLKDIEQSLCFLKDTIEIVNSAFGWPLVLSISFTILHILNKFHFMFIILLFPDEVVLQRIIADAVSVLLTFVSTDDGNSQFDIFFTVLYRHSDCLLRPGPQGSRRDVVEILQVEKKN